jgi:predicted nucleotidyltransferase
MIDQVFIQRAIDLLLASAPGARVIVFGSHARGEADAKSDLDLLVVEPHVDDPIAETTRLWDVVRHLRIAADIVVLSKDRFDYWKDTPNTLAYRASKEGRAYEQVA